MRPAAGGGRPPGDTGRLSGVRYTLTFTALHGETNDGHIQQAELLIPFTDVNRPDVDSLYQT